MSWEEGTLMWRLADGPGSDIRISAVLGVAFPRSSVFLDRTGADL